jgi:hypothetical protein
MQRFRAYTAIASSLLAALLAMPAEAQLQNFENPEHEGFDVSYCGADTASCGEGMALAWCRSQGFDYASDWAARAGIDASSRSVRLDDGSVCTGASCESFASITCGSEKQSFTMPVLGPAGRATVLSPNRRTTATELDTGEYRVLIPGCSERDAGVFECESVLEYQHCRTLMISRMVLSCRAGLTFQAAFAEPRAAATDEYEIEVDSKAKVRVTLGVRGFGQIRGDADVLLTIQPPTDGQGAWCLQRDRYVFYPTGPDGGMAEIGESAACDEPIAFSFEPNEDDLMRAYDLCDTFAAWGSEIDDSMEILAGGLFQIRSASPEFVAAHPTGGAVIAPFVMVKAPLTVECRI